MISVSVRNASATLKQQDRHGQKQQIRLVPIDRQVLLVGAAAAATARRDAPLEEAAQRRMTAVRSVAPLDAGRGQLATRGALIDRLSQVQSPQ